MLCRSLRLVVGQTAFWPMRLVPSSRTLWQSVPALASQFHCSQVVETVLHTVHKIIVPVETAARDVNKRTGVCQEDYDVDGPKSNPAWSCQCTFETCVFYVLFSQWVHD